MDLTRIEQTIKRYSGDVNKSKLRIAGYQKEILEHQSQINLHEQEIQEHKESIQGLVDFIKVEQNKIFGAEEAIVALTEIID